MIRLPRRQDVGLVLKRISRDPLDLTDLALPELNKRS
ncbi:unnamed protein product [Tenebrio molitor]|nr:unnamed protein product [Tenebrio molitor]